MDTLELVPGKGVGLFRLGDTLWSVLDMLRSRKTEVPKIEVSWDPDVSGFLHDELWLTRPSERVQVGGHHSRWADHPPVPLVPPAATMAHSHRRTRLCPPDVDVRGRHSTVIPVSPTDACWCCTGSRPNLCRRWGGTSDVPRSGIQVCPKSNGCQ